MGIAANLRKEVLISRLRAASQLTSISSTEISTNAVEKENDTKECDATYYDELDLMAYKHIQIIAKEQGLKANVKREDLIGEIRRLFREDVAKGVDYSNVITKRDHESFKQCVNIPVSSQITEGFCSL